MMICVIEYIIKEIEYIIIIKSLKKILNDTLK